MQNYYTIKYVERMNKSFKKLSVIIPAYNEAGTIARILGEVVAVELPCGIEKEILVIDDCSTDGTGDEVYRMKKLHPSVCISYVKLDKNRGKGYAVRTGIDLSTGDIIIIQDADLEYDPHDYSALLQPILSGGYKVVYGSRILNKDNQYSYPLFYLGGRLVSLVTSLLFGRKITDEPTCYKMFDAALLKSIPLTCDRFGFCPEVTAQILGRGYEIKEVPISYYPRSKEEGKKIKWRDGVAAIYILMKYRFGKKKPVTVKRGVKREKREEQDSWKRMTVHYAVWLIKNVSFFVLALLAVRCTLLKHPTYHWVYSGLLKENMEMIKKYPDLTFEEKMQMKLGADYEYLHVIRQSTPPNAVILYPSQKAFQKEGSPFRQEIYNKLYATRFLYPRRLVSESQLKDSIYVDKITHIAIVNGEGIDKLSYKVDSTIVHAILPVTRQKK